MTTTPKISQAQRRVLVAALDNYGWLECAYPTKYALQNLGLVKVTVRETFRQVSWGAGRKVEVSAELTETGRMVAEYLKMQEA